MKSKLKLNPDLLIEQALRMEQLGRKGLWVFGREHSSAELRKLASEPIFPLSPFNAFEFYSLKTDSLIPK